MAFVVEDGTGLANANSYTTVAFMRAHWADVGTTFAQADGLLEVALVKATRYVTSRYDGSWLGHREFPEVQALSWPRLCVYKPDTCELLTGVPEQLQRAVAEYAQRALVGTNLQPDASSNPFVTRTKVKAGPVETEEQRLPGSAFTFVAIPAADNFLRGLVRRGSYVYR